MRDAAVHVPLALLNSAKPVKDGEYTHFLVSNGAVVYRVHVWGVVMHKYEGDGYVILSIDDHSGTVSVSFFSPLPPDVERVEVGDTVDVIGRLRLRNDEVSIVGDVLKIVGPKVEMLRRLENLMFATDHYDDPWAPLDMAPAAEETAVSEPHDEEEIEVETLDLEGDEW
ncbi:MAG: hypothetical protein GXN93_00635 [Candidatus Diapherotrites archaeon]|nr:hypothetical protein [Candidatus Diapherotrites archaeon]